jgi:glycosyltransferase involved in cell wall biosynthesis
MAASASISLLIVVPTLNSYPLLPRLVASLQEQTWSHWQLLFIDGPSGSGHRSWLQDFSSRESRCHWIEQDPAFPGIFGAMSQGFASAAPDDWLLFWGSDDWAASPTVLAEAVDRLMTSGASASASCPFGFPDLMIYQGRYVSTSQRLGRRAAFLRTDRRQRLRRMNAGSFRRALLLGSTPPHQATWFGPGARCRLDRYAPDFRLAGDLDYFLKLSEIKPHQLRELVVVCDDLELVHMSEGGVSGQQTQRRLMEVRRAYEHALGPWWWIPFLMRYIRRLTSLFFS